jgi:hypothetical protein
VGLEEDRINVESIEDWNILSRPFEKSLAQIVGNLPQTAFQKFEPNEHGW